MHFKYAALALVAADLGTVTAAPHKFEKRVVRVDRVPAGPRNRNALESMRFAMAKYGSEVPKGLANADAAMWAGGKYNSKCHQPDSSSEGPAAGDGSSSQEAHTHPSHHGSASNPSAQGNGNTGNGNEGSGNDGSGNDGSGNDGDGNTGNVTNQSVEDDLEYISEVTVGGQKLMMDFDTGSSDFWMFSTEMPTAQRPAPHVAYDKSKSSTFQPTEGASFSVKFGDGSSTQGQMVGTDTVEIGGVAAERQTVELASQVADQFVKDTHSNGLVGLAFSSINNVSPTKAKTFFDNIKDQLAEPIMAADLRQGAPGSYTFGKVDHTAFEGQLQFIPVNTTKGFWQFSSAKFAVGNGPVQTNEGANPAIADTGTTLMLLDDNVARRYYQQVPGAQTDQATGMYTFPCNAPLPDFHVATGPNMVTIPGQLLKYQTLNQQTGGSKKRSRSRRDIVLDLGGLQPDSNGGSQPNSDGGSQPDSDGGSQPFNNGGTGQGGNGQTCVGGIQGNKGTGIQIYGDIFFKAQYTVFNLGNNSIGFAPHA